MMNMDVKEMHSIQQDAKINQSLDISPSPNFKPPGMSELLWKKAQQKLNYPSPGKF
jgi:hypothetical protein